MKRFTAIITERFWRRMQSPKRPFNSARPKTKSPEGDNAYARDGAYDNGKAASDSAQI
jgi:hypothetical protein